MKNPPLTSHESYPDTHHDVYSRTIFGFWVYLITDFVLFGVLFATYAVLSPSIFGGPSAKDLFSLPFALMQTLLLLTSSFTAGLAGAFAHRKSKKGTLLLFGVTFLLGALFMGMQLQQFHHLSSMGHGWDQSAFLSAYFTLVGTHTLHVFFGLLWILVLTLPMFFQEFTKIHIRRLTCLRMFWQFLNIVWIFIFSFVYLMGAI